MARTISTATSNAISSTFTRPGHLVYIGWTTPVRLSTRGTMTCMGFTWVGEGFVKVTRLGTTKNVFMEGSIELMNNDLAYGTLALQEGVADIPIRIWTFDAAAVANDDPILVFDGVGDSCSIDESKVSVQLASARSKVLMAPRRFVTRENGFSILPSSGQSITWGGEKYIFERRN